MCAGVRRIGRCRETVLGGFDRCGVSDDAVPSLASFEGRSPAECPLPHSANQLLARLPESTRTRLGAIGQIVALPLSQVLGEAHAPTTHVHFPVDGFVSLLAQVDSQHVIEVGMVGREGMLGIQVALGVPCEPLKSLVQGEGRALRIEAAAFQLELATTPALRATLYRYLYILLSQHTRAAACLRFHMIEQRLARWLLMSQDRALSDVFKFTQEFLAYMLGVRRVGVTVAAGELQRRNLISYERGVMTIVDRAGLENAACSCYASDLAVYNAQFAVPMPDAEVA